MPPRGVKTLSSEDFNSLTSVEIYERLGGGGSGATVYRCSVNGQNCAVKILDLSQTPEENIENFIKEIKLLEGLSHPNIIKYLGHDLIDGNVRCFMEFYPHSLYTMLRRRAKEGFSLKEVVFIAREVSLGLSYLHSLDPKIIHRDLKSGNILVSLDSTGSVNGVKITGIVPCEVVLLLYRF
jgi:serine/threonine protein kinase